MFDSSGRPWGETMFPTWDRAWEGLSAVAERDPVSSVPKRDAPDCRRTKGGLLTCLDWGFLRRPHLKGVQEEEACFLESRDLGREGAGIVRIQEK